MNKVAKLLLPAFLLAPFSVHAEERIMEEVVVTATKRATTAQEVPFSLNVQTQEDIQRAGASNIEELSRNIAGLTVQNLGPGQSQVAIRGVSAGQIVRDQPGVKEQVGVYLDESVISLSLFTPDFDLYDLNRVENAPRSARHDLRIGFSWWHYSLHYKPACTGRNRRFL